MIGGDDQQFITILDFEAEDKGHRNSTWSKTCTLSFQEQTKSVKIKMNLAYPFDYLLRIFPSLFSAMISWWYRKSNKYV